MIAYDIKLLKNYNIVRSAKSLESGGFITKEQLQAIKLRYPSFIFHNNILVRFGFFALTLFLSISVCALIGYFLIQGGEDAFKILVVVLSFFGLMCLEHMAQLKYYNNGILDAVIWFTVVCIAGAFVLILPKDSLYIPSTIFLLATFIFMRYCYILAIPIICVSLFTLLKEMIVVMGFSVTYLNILMGAIIIFIVNLGIERVQRLSKTYNYVNYSQYVSAGLLLTNYLWIISFLNKTRTAIQGENNIFSNSPYYNFVLLGFAALLSICYLIFALKSKERMILWAATLTSFATIYLLTITYTTLSVASQLVIFGCSLFLLAVFCIKKLKHKERGITFKPARFAAMSDNANLEALVSAAAATGIKDQLEPTEAPMTYGGGGFSGGGSEGNF